jgi:NTP pyrophosphatase (non-canonical NTP hydrolase)
VIDLEKLQKEVGDWSLKNFGDQSSSNPLLGAVEEVGELCHAHLKSQQGIRGYDDPAKGIANKKDALGDILIYLMDYCSREGISLQEALIETASEVLQRDWVGSPTTG